MLVPSCNELIWVGDHNGIWIIHLLGQLHQWWNQMEKEIKHTARANVSSSATSRKLSYSDMWNNIVHMVFWPEVQMFFYRLM